MTKEDLLTLIRKDRLNSYQEIEKAINLNLSELVESGDITLANDHSLGGRQLEIRIKMLFKSIAFDIEDGRPSLEDFIIKPSTGFSPKKAIVLEIKSGKSPTFGRDDLRQLDDWVFELSGEEQARKHGLVEA